MTWLRLQLVRGALRLLGTRRRRIVAWRALQESGLRSIEFERDGIVWNLPRWDEIIGFHLFVDGGFQRADIMALLAWAERQGVISPRRQVVVDVGANIGSTSIPLARDGHCRVVAIEPTSENFRHLTLNIERNGLADRVTAVKRAVLATPGRITMSLPTTNIGAHFVLRGSTADAEPEEHTHRETVDGDGLTAIVEAAGVALDEVAFVWADVQGCEADVIASGAALWARGVPLWAEVEPHSLAKQGSLETFAPLAARHFDRFIHASALVKGGDAAVVQPIAELDDLIRAFTPNEGSTDVLFLAPER